MSETLGQLRRRIKRESPYVGQRPYSHNIIRLTLSEIDKRFGRPAANKAVVDFKLESKGFNEEPENEAWVQAMLLKHNAEIIDQ